MNPSSGPLQVEPIAKTTLKHLETQEQTFKQKYQFDSQKTYLLFFMLDNNSETVIKDAKRAYIPNENNLIRMYEYVLNEILEESFVDLHPIEPTMDDEAYAACQEILLYDQMSGYPTIMSGWNDKNNNITFGAMKVYIPSNVIFH